MTQAMDFIKGLNIGDYNPAEVRIFMMISEGDVDLQTIVDFAHVALNDGTAQGSSMIPFVVEFADEGGKTVEGLAEYLSGFRALWKVLDEKEQAVEDERVKKAGEDYEKFIDDPLAAFQKWLEKSPEKSHRPIEIALAWKALSGTINRKDVELARIDYDGRDREDTSDLVRMVASCSDSFSSRGLRVIVVRHIWGETQPSVVLDPVNS
jgi:hypothetical protein